MIWNWMSAALAEEAAGEAEAQPTWLQTAFGDLGEWPWWVWAVVLVLLVAGLAAYRSLKGTKTVWNAKMLSLGAVCIALSTVLSNIKLLEMPQGGSITAASMLPLMLFAYVYGVGPGLMVGAVYGVLQYLFGGWFVSVPQVLLDYPIAFAMTGLAGAFGSMQNESVGLSVGVVLASVGRFAAAVLSGVVFFAEYAGGQNPWVYSILYNGAYMLPECAICVVLCLTVGVRLARQLRRMA